MLLRLAERSEFYSIPERSKDDDVTVLATKIKDKIQDKMTYPGTVTVNVIRETRSQAVAK